MLNINVVKETMSSRNERESEANHVDDGR